MRVNLEKIIPEVWWDFFGRLVPGLVIVGELFFLGYFEKVIKFNMPPSWSGWLVVAAAYVVGHFLQPFGSRIEEVVSRYYKEQVEGKVIGSESKQRMTQPSLLRRALSLAWSTVKSKRLDENHQYDFKDVINLPENFSENYTVAKKKHSEAVSFFSVFFPSYIIWILSLPEISKNISYTFIIFLLLAFTILMLANSDSFKIGFAFCLFLLVVSTWMLWLVAQFCTSYGYGSPLICAIPFFVLFAGIERTKNKIRRELWVAKTYAHSNDSDKRVCRNMLAGTPKE